MRTELDTPPDLPAPGGGSWSLRRLFALYRGRILLTYALLNLENLLRLAQPFVLGLAINDLLRSSYTGLLWFVAQHVGHVVVGSLRRVYDTRAFTAIYTDVATGLVVEQRGRAEEVSSVAARSSLSRAFVDFFEYDVPLAFRSLYSVVGAFAMLALYDWMLLPFCAALVIPAWILNSVYGRKTLFFNRLLHDELEREVAVIESGRADEVRGHYDRVARRRIQLSDWEAINFCLMECFVLVLIVAALVRLCLLPDVAAGDVFAVFRYLMMFLMGLDSVPVLVQQFSRLRDVGRRIDRKLPSPPVAS